MKRKLSLLLVVMMLFTVLVACNNETTTEDTTETPVETAEEATTDETEEEEVVEEEPTEEVAEETDSEPVEVGPIDKIGLGNVTSTTSSADAGDNAARAQADVTVAAVAFDADGRIVDVKIDVAQTKINFNEDNTDGVIDDETDFRTKMEKGPDYDMKGSSPIDKEYDEQMTGFQDYLIGMTAEEVTNIPTKEADENHQNVPDVAELASVTTIDIAKYQQAVQEAWDNAIDAQGATKLGLGINTDAANTPAGDKPARIQVNTYMNALGLDDSDVIVANYIDVVQAKIDVNEDGTIVEKVEDVQSKKELKDDYDMRGSSAIEKEWFEQMEAWEAWSVGKTVEEVQGIPVKEANPTHQHVPDVAELESSVTITVEGYQEVMGKALENANK